VEAQDSWFPPNEFKDQYEVLCGKDPNDINGLKALLLKRAVEDALRIGKLRTDRASLSDLMQKGAIGEATWHHFLAAENEMELEVQEVIEEAEALTPGWGETIFQNAAQLIAFERKKQMEMQAKMAQSAGSSS
jgi:translocation protein SEC66